MSYFVPSGLGTGSRFVCWCTVPIITHATNTQMTVPTARMMRIARGIVRYALPKPFTTCYYAGLGVGCLTRIRRSRPSSCLGSFLLRWTSPAGIKKKKAEEIIYATIAEGEVRKELGAQGFVKIPMALHRATRQVDDWAEEAGFETLIVDSATSATATGRST